MEKIFEGLPMAVIGEVTDTAKVEVDFEGKNVVNADVVKLRESWEKPMVEVFGT